VGKVDLFLHNLISWH